MRAERALRAPRATCRVTLLLPALALLAGSCARAPQKPVPADPVTVEASVDRAEATIGDRIAYTLTVEHAPGIEVELPSQPDVPGLAVVEAETPPPRRLGGRVRVERRYTLRADRVGSHVLPPRAVAYRPAAAGSDGEDGPPAGTARAPEVRVEVRSVLPAEGADDIRDVKPLRGLLWRPSPATVAAAVLTALALAAAGWLWWRRRPEAAPAPPPQPHEIALRELAALRNADLSDPAAVRRLCFRISEVVRAYVEGRFDLNATDLTTDEILTALGRLPDLGPAQAQSLRQFLLATDRVKFAAHRPLPAEVEEIQARAVSLVEATRPRPAEAPGPAAEEAA